MKKLFACLTILFAITFLSAAQTASASGNGQAGATDQATEKKSAPKKGAGGAMLTGCLTANGCDARHELMGGSEGLRLDPPWLLALATSMSGLRRFGVPIQWVSERECMVGDGRPRRASRGCLRHPCDRADRSARQRCRHR